MPHVKICVTIQLCKRIIFPFTFLPYYANVLTENLKTFKLKQQKEKNENETLSQTAF